MAAFVRLGAEQLFLWKIVDNFSVRKGFTG